MRRLAFSVAAMGFFGLAVVGWISKQPVFTCAVRALIGAGVLFVVVTLAGRLVLNIMADAILRSRLKEGPHSAEGESGVDQAHV